MDKTFQKFPRAGVDLSPLGFELRADAAPYFCTPKGARILGWAGVGGIHYCTVRGSGSRIFAVSPMNAAPECMHPIAESFEDFLRLLLACGDAAVLEQSWQCIPRFPIKRGCFVEIAPRPMTVVTTGT